MIFSCRNEKIPENILSPVEMGNILLDMQIAKAYNDSYIPQGKPYNSFQREQRLKGFYSQILRLHHTDTMQFKKSFRFYEAHPDKLKKIYTLMTDSLNRKKKRQELAVEKKMKVKELNKRLTSDTSNLLKKVLLFKHTISDSIHRRSSRISYPYLFD